MGLGAYLTNPGSFPSSQVIYHNDDFVLINDLFPKATVHTLLLPRSKKFSLMHPFDAMEDQGFREKVVAEAAAARQLVAKELQRRLGPHSRSDARREAVLNGDAGPDPSGSLPAGRDWLAEIRVGFHAQPSMSHLHVHIFSRDMHSDRLKHRKHYNSFNTPFLVPLEDFPLADEDERRGRKSGWLSGGMRCWRCGRVWEKSFVGLKEHLDEEFEDWKRQ